MRFRLSLHILLSVACFASAFIYTPQAHAQAAFEEDQLGAWYMLFWNTRFGDGPWGLQGDNQFRNWNVMGDLEQLLNRVGVNYAPDGTNITLTLGYANIVTGEFGDGDDVFVENRIYQEVLIPQKIGSRLYLRHRYRNEQRWVENQDFRTRLRYMLFVDVPFNQKDLSKGAFYIAFYNEIFMNLQKDIGNNQQVSLFDRNRTYASLGYAISDKSKVQTGYMVQVTNNIWKGQMQLSLHQTF